MNIESIRKGRTEKVVLVSDVDYVKSTPTEVIVDFALNAAGETPVTHFGTNVKHYPVTGHAEVTIYTD